MDYCEKVRSKLFQLFTPIFNLSLFVKMGIVIFACICVNSMISFYLYSQLKNIYERSDIEPYDRYETLAQIALREIAVIIAVEEKDTKKTSEAAARLNNLLMAAVKGGSFADISDGILIQQVNFRKNHPDLPSVILEDSMKTAAKMVEQEGNHTAMMEAARHLKANMTQLLKWSHGKQDQYRNLLLDSISNLSSHIWWIIAILAAFLIWGALAFLFMVIRPINAVTEKIKQLSSGKGAMYEDNEECLEDYYADDEIGKLVHSVNEMVIYYRNLATFKHLIEEDETMEEVYERLARIFRDDIKLPAFLIYQVSNSQNSMTIMYKHPQDLEVNPEKLIDVSRCRAKRTGHIVTSMGLPGSCRIFLWEGEAHHYCIPMISAGKCVGVVQFLLPFESSTRKVKGIRQKLDLAERYINEAIPVLEAKRYAQSLREQTYKDPLTGLFNRRFVDSILENLVAGISRRNTVLGILMADLDFFKSVNDKYGHDTGDIVLKEVAEIIKSNIRKADLAIRFGGEEFLMLLVDIKEGEAEMIAEKLRATVEQHKIVTPKGQIQKTISIGVSEYPVDAQGIWEAIKYADVALYKAKEMGRNRVVRFRPEMWQDADY